MASSLVARGQASAETIAVFGVSLLIVLLFMGLALGAISDAARTQSQNDAYQSVRDLASAADEVYAQGEGASRTVLIKLSRETVFGADSTFIGKPGSMSENSSVQSRTILINSTFGTASSDSREPLFGSFPSAAGSHRMRVVSMGSHVSISPMLFEPDLNAVHASMAQNESRQVVLAIYRMSPEAVNVTINEFWGYSQVGISLSTQSFEASESGTEVALQFNSSSQASGFYNSILLINATSASGATDRLVLPVTVEVVPG